MWLMKLLAGNLEADQCKDRDVTEQDSLSLGTNEMKAKLV